MVVVAEEVAEEVVVEVVVGVEEGVEVEEEEVGVRVGVEGVGCRSSHVEVVAVVTAEVEGTAVIVVRAAVEGRVVGGVRRVEVEGVVEATLMGVLELGITAARRGLDERWTISRSYLDSSHTSCQSVSQVIKLSSFAVVEWSEA